MNIFFPDLPTTSPSTSRELDISQMYSIFRNGINIVPPRKGWGNFPDANDTNMADDIERLRKYRNKISHENSSKMTTVDFNESVLDLIRVTIYQSLMAHYYKLALKNSKYC